MNQEEKAFCCSRVPENRQMVKFPVWVRNLNVHWEITLFYCECVDPYVWVGICPTVNLLDFLQVY